jgi:hypothetical protein
MNDFIDWLTSARITFRTGAEFVVFILCIGILLVRAFMWAIKRNNP